MALKIGILGAGRIGRIHCQNALMYPQDINCVAICDPKLDRQWADALPIPYRLTDEEKFWQLDLDAIIICTPSDQHAHQVKRAIALGKHILCEKPLDKSLQAHIDIQKLIVNSQIKLQIGFNRRFDKDFAYLQSLVAQDYIGKPYYLRITSRDPALPSLEYLKHSGGMFMDMTIHDFDMARFIMGSEIVEVYARGAALVNPALTKECEDIDTAIITLKFANGAMGVIDNSRQAVYGYDQRLEIFGSKGAASNKNHSKTTIVKSDASGVHSECPLNFFLERYEDSYRQELQAFVRTIHKDASPTPSIDDALKAITIAQAAKESLTHNLPIVLAGV